MSAVDVAAPAAAGAAPEPEHPAAPLRAGHGLPAAAQPGHPRRAGRRSRCIIAVAVRVAAPPDDPAEGPPFLFEIAGNGVFVALTALTVVLPLFLPLAVVGGVRRRGGRRGEPRHAALPAGRAGVADPAAAGEVRRRAWRTAWSPRCTVAGSAPGLGALLFPIGPVTLLSGSPGLARRRALAAAAGRAVRGGDDGRAGRDRAVRLHADRVADRGDGDHRGARGDQPGARRRAAARLAAPVAVQPLLAGLRRPAARPDRGRRRRSAACSRPRRTCWSSARSPGPG